LLPVLDALLSQDAAFRPTQMSRAEDDKRVPFARASWQSGSMLGYLWAPECEYGFRLSAAESITVIGLAASESRVLDVFEALCRLELAFGYACAAEERAHRNRIVKTMGYGVHEAWVGRDYSRYLPGLYWLTAVPVILLQNLGIPLDQLRKVSLETSLISNRTWLMRLYDNPFAWADAKMRIDHWCQQTSGVFSKATVEAALDSARSFVDAAEILEKWP
jgi:hypothetical protein